MARYRVTAVDKPGYTGTMRVFPSQKEAVSFAEQYMRSTAPKVPAAWLPYGQHAYVMVEKIYRSGDHQLVAKWDGKSGQWNLAQRR